MSCETQQLALPHSCAHEDTPARDECWAFLVPFGAILRAWRKVRKDIRDNADLLDRLNEIEQEYASGPHGGIDGEGRQQEKRERQIVAGKTMFTYRDLENMPELVKHLMYSHALSGLGTQVSPCRSGPCGGDGGKRAVTIRSRR